MSIFNKILFLLLSVAIMWPASSFAQHGSEYKMTPEINGLLVELDSLLASTERINAVKEERISAKRNAFLHPSSDERRYWLAADLYDEFKTYDSDSALRYAAVALDIARSLGRRDLIDDMKLNSAYVYSATGLLDEAKKWLSDIDIQGLSTTMLWKYYDSLLFLDSRRTQYIGGNPNADMAYPPEIDSLLQVTVANISPDDPNYCWFVGWSCFKGSREAEGAIPTIKESVDRRNFDNRRDAMDAWVLSKLYEYAGDYTNKLKYLLLSAIADQRSSNKEIASLEEIAAILLETGDLDRSNAYITHTIACANSYKSRVRLGHLAQMQDQTLNAIYDRSAAQERQTRMLLVALVVILFTLIAALVVMIRKTRELRRSRADVERINRELQTQISETEATREELRVANAKLSEMYESARESAGQLARINESKENYIASVFGLCSDYIDKLDSFRKNILRMIVARKFDEIHELTKNPELSHAEIKELYANFDKIFLSLYPDFVDNFNSLLRPDERIELKRPDQLTTELRIYALVRLGLNDSVKIAKFLHCSVQTVYNTRQRARNKAVVARELFAETVKSLGKPAI